uniref:DUF7495 domain-containing protein n=1 Tax=Skeletonema marinoi TaxID=267567 RepID=A0A7S1YML9_9STRA|mmetsp:Transcript_523/g.841  ORF Transcript_523/g.841 Transcript_523/m.841 type:complete len:917 (+) Transcript_523:39-2789(+)
MSGLNDEERADEASPESASSNGEVDLLDSTTAAVADEIDEATDVENEEDEFHDTAEELSNEENGNILVDFPPNIASVTALVNEVRSHNNTESPLSSHKIEAMEQGSRYRDDPNSDDSSSLYHLRRRSYKAEAAIKAAATKTKIAAKNAAVAVKTKFKDKTTSPTKLLEKIGVENDFDFANYHDVGGGEDARILSNKNRTNEETVGVWSSSQRPQLRSVSRYNFIGSFIRSKIFTYCAIVATLIGIAIAISAAVTKGFEHTQHRNDLLHPKWENDGGTQDGETVVWVKNPDDSENEGSIMQTDTSSLPTEIYTDKQDGLEYQLANAYVPIWFDRETGWNGSTHAEAIEFCNSRDDTSLVFAPCPYDVYCPGGKKKLLFDQETDEADSWAPVLETNKWVQVGSGGRVCDEVQMDDLGEKLTRHIMCCLQTPLDLYGNGAATSNGVQAPPNVKDEGGDSNVEDPIPPPPMSSASVSNNNDGGGSVGTILPSLQQSLLDEYNPHWFSDVQGWSGTTYDDAKRFCEYIKIGEDQDDKYHLCPWEVYCPHGPLHDKPLYYENDAYEGEQWAPISDENKRWTLIGNEGNEGQQACDLNPLEMSVDTMSPTVKKHIMCCRLPVEESSTFVAENHNLNIPGEGATVVAENDNSKIPGESLEHFNFEGSVFNELNPVWYGTDEWISGSHDDALHFCNFKGKSLCPYAAYCPYGPGKHPVDGWVASKEFEEQWAPMAQPNQWVLIGAENDNPFSQCQVTESPSFGFDKSEPELKLHIMCCDKEQSDVSSSEVESSNSEASNTATPVEESFDADSSLPVWYSFADGWDGGGHETALLFCLGKEKTLCPVEIYCPNGPTKPPLKGSGGASELEQWAPASDKENYWIMIGLYGMDEGTQCQDQDDILGGYPSWGLDGSYFEHKQHILCCP